VTDLSTFVEPGRDKVTVDGRAARVPAGHTYYLLHKPEGIMTTVRDPEGRATVLEFVPARPRVFPVGRLDRDTSGALLLTDDGYLAQRILHPRYGVEKEYIVVVEGTISDDAVSALGEGVLLDGERRPTAPAKVEVLDRKTKRSKLRLIVHEGRNRQVRRMLEAVGYAVLQLRRERIGPVSLGDLVAGLFRPLTAEEVAALRHGTARSRSRAARPAARARSRDAKAVDARPRSRATKAADARPRSRTAKAADARPRQPDSRSRHGGDAKHAVRRTRKTPVR
jgi:23S rRNA pseudouridine2605 synthase